ncbi:MAG TPA: helix-turn-helix transcriptional regulator [Thermomicrobiales bacterium]|nr:helix-turn-helix transcriptional regulator [Thermomicrobiales bacterium]
MVPSRDEPDALVVSRRELRDLSALLALPAMWVDRDPAYIAAGLLGVLFGLFRLESAYVRFDDPAGGPALERWRPAGPGVPIELAQVLAAAPARERGAATVPVAAPDGGGTVRVTSIAPALPQEAGLVLVGARRADFPTDLELHLLRVTVAQGTISIHSARQLAGERAARAAAEAALSRRNAFLATLAQDLTLPLAALAERAAQARALATESDRPPALDGVAVDPAAGAGGASRSPAIVPPLASPARLSRREAEVLGLLAQGLSNKEIAGVLWLSERTVERHITDLYRKIGVGRRSEATAFALQHGLAVATTPGA